MSAHRGLTANQKKSAVLRCEDIHQALHSLLFDVLNGMAYSREMDDVIKLMNHVDRLRYRLDSYPELATAPNDARIQELINQGNPPAVARALAKDEEVGATRKPYRNP